MDAQTRIDGYAPIRDYGAIGDGRTVALVASDGSIDWLCLPNLDSPSVFGALLDARTGGRFELRPDSPWEAKRRYTPRTNVLETTFTTSDGSVRVVDAITLPTSGLAPDRELVRRVEGLSGHVPLVWRLEPRFDYGARAAPVALRAGVPTLARGGDALALVSWNAGPPDVGDGVVQGRFTAEQGGVTHLVLSAAHQEPLVLPARDDVDRRLAGTERNWSEWSSAREYDGPWRDEVLRSALALKLLVFAPSGAIAAAPTTSLPEEIGGERNWDYRFSWPRDAAFALRALLALGCADEARAFFSWLLHASQITKPEVQVLYRLDGRADTAERTLPLAGYRGSRPVRIGNAAAHQRQLDVYGEVFDAAGEFAVFARGLDADHAKRLAGIADLVCRVWREPDVGIWETRGGERDFTHSKMMCFVALDRACELCERGLLSGDAGRWRRERDGIRRFVETRCYSDEKRSYVRSADGDALDASLLLAALAGYDDPLAPRMVGTVDAVRRELGRGPFLHRYTGDDGLPGEESAFVACAFWLVEAYARQRRVDEASELMDEVVAQANDVGLYAEEIDPSTGDFLGNFPQGLSHLALINAAVAIAEAER